MNKIELVKRMLHRAEQRRKVLQDGIDFLNSERGKCYNNSDMKNVYNNTLLEIREKELEIEIFKDWLKTYKI